MKQQTQNNESEAVPTFVGSFWESIREAKAEIGYRAYFPYLFISLCIAPNLILAGCRIEFSDSISQPELVTILSAFAVVAGILAAFSISAMTQVQQIASTFPFSDYLRDLRLLNSFIFFPQFTFFLQVIAVISNTTSIVLIYVLDSYNFQILIENFGILIYVSLKTFRLVDHIRKLTWHFADYNILFNKYKADKSSGG